MRHKTILKRKRNSGVTFLEDEAAYMLSRDKAKHAWYLDPSSLFVSRRDEIEIIFCDDESSREKVAARSVVCVHSCMHVDVFLPSWPLIERLESGLLPHIGIFSSALTSKRLVIPNQFMVMVGYRIQIVRCVRILTAFLVFFSEEMMSVSVKLEPGEAPRPPCSRRGRNQTTNANLASSQVPSSDTEYKHIINI